MDLARIAHPFRDVLAGNPLEQITVPHLVPSPKPARDASCSHDTTHHGNGR
jgi:hypothetical protein